MRRAGFLCIQSRNSTYTISALVRGINFAPSASSRGQGVALEKIYWDDLEVGALFWGDSVTVDPEEMLEYHRRNDPQPFHLDENAAQASHFRGLIASAGYTVMLCILINYTHHDEVGSSWRLRAAHQITCTSETRRPVACQNYNQK